MNTYKITTTHSHNGTGTIYLAAESILHALYALSIAFPSTWIRGLSLLSIEQANPDE